MLIKMSLLISEDNNSDPTTIKTDYSIITSLFLEEIEASANIWYLKNVYANMIFGKHGVTKTLYILYFCYSNGLLYKSGRRWSPYYSELQYKFL